MLAWPFLILSKDGANLCPSQYFHQTCPSVLTISWCLVHREKQLVRRVNASNLVVTLAVLSPNMSIPGALQLVSRHFSDTVQHVERDSLWL